MSNFILLADTAEAGSPTGSWIMIIVQVAILGLLLYFMLIRPQKKQQKQLDAMLSTLAIGDSVLTTGGFYGVVIDVMEDVVIVEFGNNKNCRIPMKKSAIVELEKPDAEKNAK
ncbi:MAG TPA: preprotein translocase subunit YajC [Lachnospiraceae bacterium]|jgi:preprotein translocase subunit YajC|nr:preprotein translocase subunit YajC [Lachnospiraceae bacterium]HCM13557.1 preprotein translocase subunit YajC [Lachnospiraceae bacterium]HCR40676.1 preprotein translocase subunit YajC [Lachnospiraceae bacterium]